MQPRKIALVVAIAAIVAVLAFAFGEPAPPVGSAPRAGARTTPVAAATADAPAVDGAQRQNIAAAPAPDADALAHPFAFELEVTLRDRDGLPVAGKQVLLGPELCSLVPMHGTGPDGITHAQWCGKTDRMDVVLCVGDELRRITVFAGSTRRCVLEGPARELGSPQGWTEGLHPFARFVDDVAGKWQDNSGGIRVGSLVGHYGLAPSASGMRREQPPPPTVLEGMVYGDHGVPTPRVTLCCGLIADVPLWRTQSDERGCFRFVLPGESNAYEVRAGGGDAGLAHARIEVVAEQATRWDAHLTRESAIRGRANSAEGRPLAGWTVEVEGIETPWFDACTVRDDGTFILPNQPPGPHTVLLRSSDRYQLPVATVSPVQPDGDELLLRYDATATAGRLQIEPELPEWVQGFCGRDRNAMCEVRVWQEATGRVTSMASAAEQSLDGLPAGWYRVEITALQFGWHDLGRHFVDGRSTVDLGRFALPEPGRLRIAHPHGSVPPGDAIEQQICESRADCEVHVAPQELAKGTDLTLPAGDYWLLWRDVRGAKHVRAFTMRSGAETWVDTTADVAPK